MNISPRFPNVPFLFVAITALALVSVATGLYLKSFWNSALESFQQQELIFDKIRAVATYKSKLEVKTGSASTPLLSELFFASAPQAIVSAQLSANFKQMAANRNVEILRSSDLPATKEGSLNLAGGVFDLSGSMPNILALIEDTENAKPLLFIDRLELHANMAATSEQQSETAMNATLNIVVPIAQPLETSKKVTE
jgi:Type II secretion system (T2SS), protein M subtype b